MTTPDTPKEATMHNPGEEIVAAQNPRTLDEAKRFAAAWIDTAAMFSENANYWKSQYDRSIGQRLRRFLRRR